MVPVVLKLAPYCSHLRSFIDAEPLVIPLEILISLVWDFFFSGYQYFLNFPSGFYSVATELY